MKCGLLAVLAVGAAADAPARKALAALRTRIVPALDPVSDPRFFGSPARGKADYPTDGRPTVKSHFSYPFPKMQDTNDYDKDFVKDENDDDGSWAAQADYDRLRAKLSKQKERLSGAEAKKLKYEGDLTEAEAEELEARKKSEEAADRAKQARDSDDKTSADTGNVKEDIGRSTGEVEAEIQDLDDCKAKLAEAKEKLRQAIDDVKAAKEAYATSSAEEKRASALESTAKAEEARLEAEVKKNERELEEAEERSKKAKESVAKLETDLEAAAKQVHKFRSPDPDGGVTRRSSAGTGPALSLMAAAATAIAQLW